MTKEMSVASGAYMLALAAKYLFVGTVGVLLMPLLVLVVPVWLLMVFGYSTCRSFGWANSDDDKFFRKWIGQLSN